MTNNTSDSSQESVDNNQKQLDDSDNSIVGFGAIEKQNEKADDSIDIVKFYKNGIVKKIYTFDSNYLKDIVSQGNIIYATNNISIDYDNNIFSIYYLNNSFYYVKQTVETDSNNIVKNAVLKLYKYGKSKELYTFPYGQSGNNIKYIGNGLFEFVDSANKENNVIVDNDGKTHDLFITNEDNSKEKLEITKYHNINYKYVKIELRSSTKIFCYILYRFFKIINIINIIYNCIVVILIIKYIRIIIYSYIH